MPQPLLLRPVAEAQYLEKRKPVDVLSFIKSPYGIMIVVSLFAIFIFPMMKMDPQVRPSSCWPAWLLQWLRAC